MAKMTKTEAVRQAILKVGADGRRISQTGFWQSVYYEATKLLQEHNGERAGIPNHILGRGAALVPNLKFAGDAAGCWYWLEEKS